MANTTFTGNVRENGDGLRTSIAGSMAATANFHIPNTLTAGDGNVQKSETDLTTVILPKGAVVYKIVIWDGSAAGGGTMDIGYTPIGAGTVVANPDGFADGIAVDAKSETAAVGAGGTAGADLGGISTIINAVEYGPAIVSGTGVREQLRVTHTAGTSQAGSASGTLYYFVADTQDGAESA
tara:strand:+ start:127 stop:669 length:543 start_codon:yes stop_codon:yes gene_type:complete